MTDTSSAPQAASNGNADAGAQAPMNNASAASAAAATAAVPVTSSASSASPAPASGKKPWETLPVTVKVNGESHGPMDVPAGLMMIDFLHETLGLIRLQRRPASPSCAKA